MPSIVIRNISPGNVSLDIPVPSGGVGEGHPKAIRTNLKRTESVDVGEIVTIADLNRTREFQDLLAAGLVSVTTGASSSDLDPPEGGGWLDTAALITLATLTDSVSIGAAALVSSEKLLVSHSGSLVARLQSTSATATGAILQLVQLSASPAASDVVGQIQFKGRDSAVTPNETEYARIEGWCLDPTDAAEIGSINMYAAQEGVLEFVASFSRFGTSFTGFVSATSGPEVGIVFDKGAAGAANDTLGDLAFYGNNASSAAVYYTYLSGFVIAATAGAETGALKINAYSAGTDVEVARFHPTAVNQETSLLLRVDDAGVFELRRVVMGADDSGGSGFKLLRVAN